MRDYRFMLCRRWVLFAVAVALSAYACYWLGGWQWHRLVNKRADNSIVRTNENTPATQPADVMAAPGQGLPSSREWRLVTATGVYQPQQTVIIRYREDDEGNGGVELVVPLLMADGTSLMVDRGFYETDDTPESAADVPSPPTGQVTITGYARVDGTGSSVVVNHQSARAISSSAISSALGVKAYGGFVQDKTESAAGSKTLEHGDLPALNDGPHFFYALQWWFFGILAVFGFFYLAYDEKRYGPRSERPHREQGRGAPAPRPAARPAPRARPEKVAKPKKVRQTNVPVAYQRPLKERNAAAAAAKAATLAEREHEDSEA